MTDLRPVESASVNGKPATPSGIAIFILGIAPRSGTGFLFNLLRLHPHCRVPEPIWEDYVLQPSHLLLQYTEAVYSLWTSGRRWGVASESEGRLCQALGRGVLTFLACQAGVQGDERLLTKTPSVTNLRHFSRLFPEAYLLIVVRDGRDVVESTVRSFGAWPDTVAKRWAEGVETILELENPDCDQDLRYRIVRYEDLYLNLEDELPAILDFLDLDRDVYDLEAARALSVRGSSTYRGGKEQVDWEEPVAKGSDFNPIGRWKEWDRRAHERFTWIAGRQQIQLGYEIEPFSGHRRAWRAYNKVVDAVVDYRLSELVPPFMWRAVKKAGYALFRTLGVDVHYGTGKTT